VVLRTKRPGKPAKRGGTFRDENGGRRREHGGGRSRFAAPVIVACAVVAVLVAADYWVNAGKIYRGVEAGTVALAGKTPVEAEEILRERATGEEIMLTGAEEATLSAEELGVDYDVAATVEDAYAVGRRGDILKRLAERLRSAYGTVRLEPEVEYRREEAKARVEELASRLNGEPREASVHVRGSEVEVVGSREGYRMDVAATTLNVEEAIENMSGEAKIVGEILKPEYTTAEAERAAQKARKAMEGQLVLTAGGRKWTLSPAEIGTVLDITADDGDFRVALGRDGARRALADVYAALTVGPVEAAYDVNGTEVSVKPSRQGKKVEDAKFLDAVEVGIFEGKREYEVPVVIDEPEFTTQEAEKLKPTNLLGEYSTNYLTYDDSPGRVKNLEISSNAVNDTLLAPGEVFSFNALAQQYDYYDTKVIVGDRVDTAEGGGLCQVSSTLYMAANLAGLDVTERHAHYAELPYIRPGFDATVWFGALDMKFKNDTGDYVLIKEWVDRSTGDVHAQIYGRPTGREVEMSSKKVAEYDDEEGNPVTEWVTYQKVTENGRVVFDGVLHEDTYRYLKPEEATTDERPPN
jgi:vancomycin resistance protein YoaR